MAIVSNPPGSSTQFTYISNTGQKYPTNNPNFKPVSEGGQRMTQTEFNNLTPQQRSEVIKNGNVPYSNAPATQTQQPIPTVNPNRTSVVFRQNQTPGQTPAQNLATSNQRSAQATILQPTPVNTDYVYSPFFSAEGQKQRLTNVKETYQVIGQKAVSGVKGAISELKKKPTMTELVIGPVSAVPRIATGLYQGGFFDTVPVTDKYKGTIVEKASLITSPAAIVTIPGVAAAGVVYGPTIVGSITSTATNSGLGKIITSAVGTVARTPVGQAVGRLQTAAGNNLILGYGLAMTEGEAILRTARAISRATAPAEQKAIIKTQDFTAAMQEYNRAREKEISKRPALVQGIYYIIPGMASMTDKNAQAIAEKTATDYLVSKGYNRSTSEAAIKRTSTASDYGEIISQLNVGRLSEKYGEVQVGKALSGLVTTKNKFLIQTAGKVAIPLFKAGVLEGTAQTFNTGQSRFTTQKWITENTIKPLEVFNPFSKSDVGRAGNLVRGAAFGGLSATILGTPVISLKAKYPAAAKVSEFVGYSTDPTEWPSDQLFNMEKAISKSLGKNFNGPAYNVKGSKITFNTGTGFKVKIPTIVNVQSNIQTANTRIGTPVNIFTNVNVPSNVNVPVPVPLPIDTFINVPTTINVPVDIPVPVNIPVDIPVNVLTPVFKLPPPLLPFLGGDTGQSGRGGPGRSKRNRYLNELVAGQNFFNTMVGGGNVGKLFGSIRPKKISKTKKTRRVSKTINKAKSFSMPMFTMPKLRGF